MKFILDQPLYIHEMGRRGAQQDSLLPLAGEANTFTRLFMVGEGPLADVFTQKVCINFHQNGLSLRRLGGCRFYQIRPGFDEPILSAVTTTSVEEVTEIDDVQSGDWLLLLSDGMCEYLNEEDLASIFNRPDWTAEHKKDALLDYVSENEDNHSAYLIHVRAVEEEMPVVAEPNEVVAAPTPEQKAVSAPAEVVVETPVQAGSKELSARTLLLVLLAIYALAIVWGFARGLMG